MEHQAANIEFSGISGKISAWMMTSWRRQLFERFVFGNPLPKVFDLLNLKGNEVIIDSGCGPGFYSLQIAKRLPHGKVIGIDISDEMLTTLDKQMKKQKLQNQIDIRQGDCMNLPVDDNYADVGLTVAVWHHLPAPLKATQELFRTIKPQGRVIAIDFKDGGHEHHKHAHRFQKKFGTPEMEKLLAEAGFVNEHAELIGNWVIGYADKP